VHGSPSVNGDVTEAKSWNPAGRHPRCRRFPEFAIFRNAGLRTLTWIRKTDRFVASPETAFGRLNANIAIGAGHQIG